VIEGPVKNKEDLDNLADRLAEDVTYTVSQRAAKKSIHETEHRNRTMTLSRSQGLGRKIMAEYCYVTPLGKAERDS
jgi:hypothetical protein